jgi:hypothetical protein
MAKRSSSRGVRQLAGGAGPNQARGAPATGGRFSRKVPDSPLLRALLVRTWQEVTDGAGIVVDDSGREVKP